MSVRSEIDLLTWEASCQKRKKSWPTIWEATRFSGPRAKYYPHSVVGHRPKLIWYLAYGSIYKVHGSYRWYTVDRM